MIVAALGIGITAAVYAVDAFGNYGDLAETYEVIKKWGTKL